MLPEYIALIWGIMGIFGAFSDVIWLSAWAGIKRQMQ